MHVQWCVVSVKWISAKDTRSFFPVRLVIRAKNPLFVWQCVNCEFVAENFVLLSFMLYGGVALDRRFFFCLCTCEYEITDAENSVLLDRACLRGGF